ncbi:MAG TPA: hypothetical protein VMW62_16000 [Chloroflexota bacterium]|nr:hypothetical protein [Chloroflexota bacterium]
MVAHSRATMGAYTLRTLNAAQAIAVETDAAGTPLLVRRSSGGQTRTVVKVLDRWRIDDEWWRERPISRLYHVLLLENGTRLTVYHDLRAGSWHAQSDAGSWAR